MKLLIISHTYIVDTNREKIEELVKVPDLQVGLVVPARWVDTLRTIELNHSNTSVYRNFTIPIFFNGSIAKFFFNPVLLFKAFWGFKPDIVQVEEEPWSWSLLECLIFSKMIGAKTLFFTWQNIYSQYSHFSNLVEKINFKLADAAVAGSNEAYEILKKRGFKKNVEVIPQLGVNPQNFCPLSQPRHGQEITIGYIGRFVEEKGILDLLEAFKGLGNTARLRLVGRGPLENQITEFIENNNLDEQVEIITAVPHNQVPQFMASLDIFVLPSKTTTFWKEQFGHVLIEAMACRAAVLGSSSGAIPEVMGDGGLIFEEGNIEDLKSRLQTLIDSSKLREEIAQKGYQRVLQNFTNKKIAQKTLEFLLKVTPSFRRLSAALH